MSVMLCLYIMERFNYWAWSWSHSTTVHISTMHGSARRDFGATFARIPVFILFFPWLGKQEKKRVNQHDWSSASEAKGLTFRETFVAICFSCNFKVKSPSSLMCTSALRSFRFFYNRARLCSAVLHRHARRRQHETLWIGHRGLECSLVPKKKRNKKT